MKNISTFVLTILMGLFVMGSFIKADPIPDDGPPVELCHKPIVVSVIVTDADVFGPIQVEITFDQPMMISRGLQNPENQWMIKRFNGEYYVPYTAQWNVLQRTLILTDWFPCESMRTPMKDNTIGYFDESSPDMVYGVTGCELEAPTYYTHSSW